MKQENYKKNSKKMKYDAPINGEYVVLTYCYPGILGSKNRPGYPAISFVYQSIHSIVHFHHCFN